MAAMEHARSMGSTRAFSPASSQRLEPQGVHGRCKASLSFYTRRVTLSVCLCASSHRAIPHTIICMLVRTTATTVSMV